MRADNVESIYPLTPIQEGMLFHSSYDLKSGVYVESLQFSIHGSLDVPALKAAWQMLLERHAVLRTFFVWKNRESPLQIVLKQVELPWQEFDWRNLSQQEQQQRLSSFLEKSQELGFDLSKAPLLHLALARCSQDTYRLIWHYHHLILDGWSLAILLEELFSLYRSVRENAAEAPGKPQPFKAYVSWLQEQNTADAEAFWREILQGFSQPTPINANDVPKVQPGSRSSFASQDLRLPKATTASLKSFVRENQLTLNTLFQGAWALLLSHYSGERDVVFGAAVSGRSIALSGIETMVGMFISSLPVRAQFSPQTPVTEWLQELQAQQVQARQFEYSSLRDILGWSELNRQQGQALFESILSFNNYNFDEILNKSTGDLEISDVRFQEGSHYPLTMLIDPGEELQIRINYDHSRFANSTIVRILGHLQALLEDMAADPHQPLAAVSMLTATESRRLLVDFNQSRTPVPADKTVVQLFEAQVGDQPHAVAAHCEGQVMSYAELNSGANQLARYLRANGVKSGDLVGLYMERSFELLVGILGVLKAGGAYVPIDPMYPQERVMFMLGDMAEGQQSDPVTLLTHERLAGNLPNQAGPVIVIDRDWDEITSYPDDDLPAQASPEDLVYVIYTSGSTGKPKGVMIEHRGLVNYLWWAKKQYVDENARHFPLFTSISFDLTVTSIFVPLISGGKTVIYPEDRRAQGLELLQVIEDNAVDIVKLTPSHLALMRDYGKVAGRVKKLIVGGEDFKTDLAQAIMQRYEGGLTIFNEYGPTETVVGCMIHRYDPGFDTGASVSIGKPAANARIYILDPHLRPTPEGIVGEMYIAGDGVGRGYLNRPELTAERFLENPFAPPQRMYRTGDLGRWTASGTIDFLGRKDHQVKIGGARIELGEVEAALLGHPDISACVVDVREEAEIQNRAEVIHQCVKCGLPSNLPGTTFDDQGLCNWCQSFDDYEAQARAYFRTMDDLEALLVPGQNGGSASPEYDCLALISGGKDSTYMVYQLVEMGLRVLAFSLDNGYISEEAKRNVQRVVDDLGIDHVWGSTPAMNTIFVDSLQRFSNVCNGCFKTIYTLSMKLAREQGIKYIVTGLTKGQIFETRLEELFRNRVYDIQRIDDTILQARKAYHRMYDAVAEHLDVEIFQDDSIFEDIEFVDFYRYSNVELEEMMTFLNHRAPWVRPADTGRSTNCLINEAGIYVHTRERGFHNYAFPYSWDVRLGHKTRQEALDELNDNIDEARVKRMLEEIGYDGAKKEGIQKKQRLVAYYVSPHPPSITKLRSYLSDKLPIYMIPSTFTRLEQMPLTPNGKVDRQALAQLDGMQAELEASYVAPRNDLEDRLTGFWSDILKIRKIGVHDNFFELGGNSLPAIQFISRIEQEFGVNLPIQDFFEAPTIAEAAARVEELLILEIEQLSDEQAMTLLRDLE